MKKKTPRDLMKAKWPDGAPCFYEMDMATCAIKEPVVRYLFCSTECGMQFKEDHPELPFTLVTQRAAWQFITSQRPLCRCCGKVIWHQEEKT